MDEFMSRCDTDRSHRIHSLFAGLFIMQNRLLNAASRNESDISVKQWLLLALMEQAPEQHTLTSLGSIMGCSRQNIKKLALGLEKKGYVRLVPGVGNSVSVVATDKVREYKENVRDERVRLLKLVYEGFSDEEVEELFRLCHKLDRGIARLEQDGQSES